MTNSPTLLEAIGLAGGTLSLAGQRDLTINNSIDEQADFHRQVPGRGIERVQGKLRRAIV